MKTVALYARISKTKQKSETQLLALRDYARRRAVEETLEYVDEGISGAKERRPKLDQLMKDARLHRFDTVVVARFDRFARSVKHLARALEEFEALGIHFVSLNESIDTRTAMGKMVFWIVGAVAELERDIIRERIHAGLARARKEGKQLGRPKKIFDRERVAALHHQGFSSRQIAKMVGVSQESVLRTLKGRRKKVSPCCASEGQYDGTYPGVEPDAKTID